MWPKKKNPSKLLSNSVKEINAKKSIEAVKRSVVSMDVWGGMMNWESTEDFLSNENSLSIL